MQVEQKWPKSFEWMLYLIVMTMPIGLRGIGINSLAALGNISVSDFVLVPFLVLMAIAGAFSQKNKTYRHAISAYIVFVLCYMLLPILSIVNVFRIDGSVMGYFQDIFKLIVCLLYALVFVVFFTQSSEEQRKRFVIVSAVVATVFAMGSILGIVLYKSSGIKTFLIYGKGDTVRASSFQHDSNIAGIYQLMSLGYCFAWLFFSKRKVLPLLSIAIVSVGTLLTASKAVFLTIILDVVIMLGTLLILGKKKALFACLGILLACVGVFFLISTCTPLLDSLTNRLQQLFTDDIGVQTTGRNILWKAAGRILFEHPINFIIGIGIGMFGTATQYYQIPSILDNTDYVHNTLLSFFVECGVFQLVILCVILFVFVKRYFHALFKQKSVYLCCLLWGVASILIFSNSVTLQFNRMSYVYMAFVCCALLRQETPETEGVLLHSI